MSISRAATEAPLYLSSPIHDDVSAEIKEHTAQLTATPTMATSTMVCKKGTACATVNDSRAS